MNLMLGTAASAIRFLRRRTLPAAIALSALAAALAWLGTHYVTVLRQGSAWLDDLQVAHLPREAGQSDDVVLLTIDEDTLAQLPFRSPISRAFLADVLLALADKKPRAVGIDILFDQPTIPEQDQALLDVLATYPAPVVVAVGSSGDGLTPRQLEFQARYLAGRRVGSAAVRTTDGVVRYFRPGAPDADGTPSFVGAVAAAIGIEVPKEPVRLYYRRNTAGGPAAIRAFPATGVEHLPAAWLEGRVVLLGADLPNQDRFRTPLSVLGGVHSSMAGLEIHGHALAQLMRGESYPSAPGWLHAVLLAGAAAIGFGVPFVNVGVAAKAALAAALLAASWGLGFAAFAAGGPQLPLLGATLAFAFGGGFGTAYGRHRDRAEKRFVRAAFQRYVSPAVIEHVLRDPSKLVLGGEKREMSFLFSDLGDFTALTERCDPETIVSLLQSYFDGMLRIALEHGGTIDRLVGDSIAVFFGAPAPQPDHAARAVRCALDIDRFCERFRAECVASGVPLGVTRIGVHTGTAVVGNVGSAARFHYTAHGDCVNVAARLESANKHLGTRVCISAAAARHVEHDLLRPVGRLVLKGKTQGLDCVTLWGGAAETVREAYRRAYAALERRDPASSELFHALHRQVPDDGLVAFHCARLQRGEHGIDVVLEVK